MEQMTPELLHHLRQAAPLAATANSMSISGDTMKVAALLMAGGSLGMLLEVIDRQQAIIEQHADRMGRVVESQQQPSAPFDLEPGWALHRRQDGSLVKINLGNVNEHMLEAAENVEDLYKRGTPNTWAAVFRRMLGNADIEAVPADVLLMEQRLRQVLERAEMVSSPQGDNYWAIKDLVFDAAGDIGSLHMDDKFNEIVAAIDAEMTPPAPDDATSI